MKKVFALLLALSLMLICACALAEEETCTYTVFNETGEKITELYVTDNQTGEKSENYAGEEGLAKDAVIEISGTNKEGYEITLSFKTESGYEAAFETLHFETVPITLFSKQTVEDNIAAAGPDATSGATPISFFAPVCTYTVYNTTGEKITELFITDNATGEKSDNYAAEGLADGTVKILLTADAEKEDIEFAFNAAEGNTSLLGKIADTKGMNMDIDLNADQAGNLVMNLAIKDKDVNVKASAKVEAAEGDRKNFTVDVFANDSEKALLTITGSAGKSEDKPVSVFEGENITVLPLEKLASGEDAAVTGQLSLTATANLLKSVTVLAKNLPEDAAAWLNAQVKQLMAPKKPAVTVLPHAAE